jgi:signal transduction histidine kinase
MNKDDKVYTFLITAHNLGVSGMKRSIVVFNDITALKELEIQLFESKKLFDYFMDNIPYLVLIKDENFKIIFANKLAKQYSPKIHKGTTVDENLQSSVAVKIDALEHEAQKYGKAETIIEYKFEGTEHQLRALSFAIPQEDGRVYVGTVYVDITEQKKMANKLKEQEELMIAQSRHAAMGEMISMIAHQWRQPLSVIAMGANNILIDIELENIKEETLQMEANSILLQTQHLSKTIDDFRDFFKPNKEKERVLIPSVLEEALAVIGKSFENSNIIVQNIYDSSTEVEIYARELLQVFLNLLKNAKEALQGQDQRKITNTVYENENEVVIEICDNGGGIKDDIIDKIFDPYFSTKDEKNGTGLGLYMSKIIVEKHLKGKLEVSNRANCVCFMVKIPKNRKEKLHG